MLRCLLTSSKSLARFFRSGNGFSVRGLRRSKQVTLVRSFSVTAGRWNSASGIIVNDTVRKGRTKEAYELAFLVSEKNALSSSPVLQTPHDIKAYYAAVKTKGLLHELSSEELSTIIRLFGSLSIYAENSSQSPVFGDGSPFALHPLAPILYVHQTTGRRTHWSFVLSVARDKVVRSSPLGDSDNYWLMRAALEDAKRVSLETPKSNNIKRCLDRARQYYMSIKSQNEDWSIHQLYLTAVHDYGGREFCGDITTCLGSLLRWKGGLPPDLRIILWHVLAFPGAIISPSSRSRFLHVLRKRLANVHDILPKSTHSASNIDTRVRDEAEQPRLYDALAIRDVFVDILFSFKPGTSDALRYLHEVYPWALFECRAALCAFNDGTFATSEEKDRAAWNNLVMLSLSFALTRKGSEAGSAASVAPERGLDGGVHSQSQVLGWTVICGLAALSTELQVRSHSRKCLDFPSAQGIQEIARTLWFLWHKEEAWRAGAVMRSMPLICSATTSFVALASISRDARLAVSLVRHISDAIIYPAQFGGEVMDRSMLQECAIHFAVLSATWGVGSPPQQSWDGILGALRYAKLIPDDESLHAARWINPIANATLIDLAQVDARLAHGLFQSAPAHGLAMEDDVVLSVGKALASDGHLRAALNYLMDARISARNATLLLDSCLVNALRHYQDYLPPDLVQSFVKIFTDTSIRPTDNPALEAFIEVCIRGRQFEESIKIVQIICESSSTLLRPQFLVQLVTALISHHQYRLLGTLLQDAWEKMPTRRRSFFRSSRLQYTEQLLRLFPKATGQEIARSLRFSAYVWPVLRDHVPFHPRLARLEKRIISLKLSSRLQQAEKLDERTLEGAIHILVISGRIRAAIKLLSKHSSKISTRAGNIILSASLQPKPSRRQRKQVRHASTRLAQLVQERRFVPDRVTLNLLVKALLRWKNRTPTAALRILFDRFTMSGYPLPDGILNRLSKPDPTAKEGHDTSPTNSTSRTLFGTDVSPSTKASLPVNLGAFPKHISFTRHTRPLYRMFLKTFNMRGDYESARRIKNVLRQMEENVMRERAIRNEARRLGRIKARQKLRLGGLIAGDGRGQIEGAR